MSANLHTAKLLILDFGSQYTQLIARQVREAGVYCEVRAYDISVDELREFDPAGIILSGGPESATLGEAPRTDDSVFEFGVPVLGICYGMQTMAAQLGGEVLSSKVHEFGYAKVDVSGDSILLRDISDHLNTNDGRAQLDVWMSHGDRVTVMPEGFQLMASTGSCPIAGMYHPERHWYGLQFHPEVTHTLQGQRIFAHFIIDICGCETLWTPANIIDDAIERVRATVGSEKEIGRAHV